jgi:hypothetical protein
MLVARACPRCSRLGAVAGDGLLRSPSYPSFAGCTSWTQGRLKLQAADPLSRLATFGHVWAHWGAGPATRQHSSSGALASLAAWRYWTVWAGQVDASGRLQHDIPRCAQHPATTLSQRAAACLACMTRRQDHAVAIWRCRARRVTVQQVHQMPERAYHA